MAESMYTWKNIFREIIMQGLKQATKTNDNPKKTDCDIGRHRMPAIIVKIKITTLVD